MELRPTHAYFARHFVLERRGIVSEDLHVVDRVCFRVLQYGQLLDWSKECIVCGQTTWRKLRGVRT